MSILFLYKLKRMQTSKTSVLIRIPAQLKLQLSALAKKERRSLNQQIEHLLTVYFDNQPKPQGEKRSRKSGVKVTAK
jgi:hypothetical protein